MNAHRWLVIAVGVIAAACGGDGDVTPTAASSRPETPRAVVIERALDDLRARTGAPGALALERAGGEEWFASSGSADLEGTPISPDTRFRIGSVTKTITAALVLDAVARGELSLDDTVQSWLPGVLPEDPPVTVRMVLSHTSGVFHAGDEGDVAVDVGRIADPALRAQAQDLGGRYLAGEPVIAPDVVWVALANTHPLYFTPGTGYHYSNVNYQLAGMVLAAATGRDLPSLLDERFAQPLGLSSMTMAPGDAGLPDMRSFTADPTTGALADTTTDLLAVGNGGSGGIIASAPDLLTLLQEVLSGELLPATLARAMQTPSAGSKGTYGLGVVTFDLACGDLFGHAGAIAGMHTIALVSADGERGLVLAINARSQEDPNLLAVAEQLLCP